MFDKETIKEFIPVEYFKENDFDKTSRKIRDYVNDKPKYGIHFVLDSFNFGNCTVNTQSYPTQIIFYNNGYDVIDTFKILCIGDFAIEGNLPTLIKPNEVYTLAVRFKPVNKGIAQGAIIFDGFATIGTNYTILTGTGT